MLQSISLFGHNIIPYNLLNTLGELGMFIWGVFILKQYRSICTLPLLAEVKTANKIKSRFLRERVFVLIEAAFIFLLLLGATKVVTPLISQIFLGNSDANYFSNIFFLPVGAFSLGVLLKVSPLKLVDFIAPMNAMVLIFYKLACACQGCCYGVESVHGLFNYEQNRKEVPIQLIEAACAVVMLVILLILTKKNKHKAGLLYPLFMLMYCGSRFISEFWRDDYPNVLGPLKAYHIQCILGFIEGLIFLFVVLKWGEKITVFFENKNKAFLERAEKKQREKRQREKKIVHSKKRRK